jgi:threonine aldolase
LYALNHHVPLLKQDHQHAQQIAQVLANHQAVEGMLPVKTNIIIFKLKSTELADNLQLHLKRNDILANKVSATELRFVFHLQVTPAQVAQLSKCILQFSG